MQKVTFTYKNGRERMLSARDAELLQRLGKGTYLTRDMTAATGGFVAAGPVHVVGNQDITDSYPQKGDGLEGLDAEALRELARVRGVKVHHNAGAEKVRAALREAAE